MIYKEFKGYKLSNLGFGAMRLPQNSDGTIDRDAVEEMTAYAIAHGINYFDTAYPYHNGMSEIVLGDALSRYPRHSFYLANKYPGHQIASEYHPDEVFEEQLQKCKVDYFDFYLMHNVYEKSIDVYLDEQWGMLDYFVEQKRRGRIRHLGFSCHGEYPVLQRFLDSPYGAHMDFCQLQVNYLDWSLQHADKKCELLRRRNIPLWVMEPVRGGLLANLSADEAAPLLQARPDESVAAWAFRWLQTVPQPTMILSGMSSLAQMKDNIDTFERVSPLSDTEQRLLQAIADGKRNSVPCTACRYCCSSCPQELDIPSLINSYNDLNLGFSLVPIMKLEALPPEKQPTQCLQCGSCAQMCPQKINIPEVIDRLIQLKEQSPKWTDLCKQREAAAKALKANK